MPARIETDNIPRRNKKESPLVTSTEFTPEVPGRVEITGPDNTKIIIEYSGRGEGPVYKIRTTQEGANYEDFIYVSRDGKML